MDSPTNLVSVTEPAPSVRKEYAKPTIVYESAIETMAGNCPDVPPGKADTGCSVTSS